MRIKLLKENMMKNEIFERELVWEKNTNKDGNGILYVKHLAELR